MKVLLVNKYWREVGGVEKFAFLMEQHLLGLGHEVLPFAMQEADTREAATSGYFPSEIDFRAPGRMAQARSVERSALSREPVRQLRRLIADARPDLALVLHVYHQLGTRLLSELAKQGVPTVLSLHDYKVACPNYRFYSERRDAPCFRCASSPLLGVVNPLRERCWAGSRGAGVALGIDALATHLRGDYRKPQRVVVLNQLQWDSCVAMGVEPGRLRMIRHFVDLPSTTASRAGSEDQGRSLLYVGRLAPEKGVDVAIRAAAQVGLPLRIVGDGREREGLGRLADQVGATVTFVGMLPPDQVSEEMQRARMLLVPSQWPEVSPFVVYEAFASGIPVVGTDTGGLTDLLGDGRGLLVPIGDQGALERAITKLDGDDDLRRTMAAAASSFARTELSRERFDAGWAEALAL